MQWHWYQRFTLRQGKYSHARFITCKDVTYREHSAGRVPSNGAVTLKRYDKADLPIGKSQHELMWRVSDGFNPNEFRAARGRCQSSCGTGESHRLGPN